jgi:hypothetical protein
MTAGTTEGAGSSSAEADVQALPRRHGRAEWGAVRSWVKRNVRRWPAAVLVGAAACTSVKDCTTIGCVDAVVVRAPSGVVALATGTLTVCAGDDCRRVRFDPGPGVDVATVQFPAMDAGDHVTAALVMPDGSRYDDEVEAQSNRPNGPGCGPVCIEAEVTLS